VWGAFHGFITTASQAGNVRFACSGESFSEEKEIREMIGSAETLEAA
jgi:hypothetical protein